MEKGKLKIDKRIFSKLDKMRKSSVCKGTKEVVLIASLQHCDKVQCMTVLPFPPLLGSGGSPSSVLRAEQEVVNWF